MPTVNPEIDLASAFIRETHRSIYLTGKAGTGKTTFLRKLKENPPKRMVVTAPTGVAAINAQGVTLHSLFQLPFTPFIPNNENESQSRSYYRFSRDKLNIIRSLDLLVIDEISMVRADTLDAVDAILRRIRRSSEPFGGVQLLLIGDLHQLPPVVKQEESALLSAHYESFYFFGSHALRQIAWDTIELTHIYRQTDAQFIHILNQVRTNSLDQAGLHLLNSRYQHVDINSSNINSNADNVITLTSHNQGADRINTTNLNQLQGRSISFSATIEDEFPAYAYPTAEHLTLKVGAQVMFVRNDMSEEKRYYNGKIGTVVNLSRKHISVACPNEEPIVVDKSVWENVKYGINEETKAIEEQVVGTFTQFPLRLAWAITIHKSQGLTFDAVRIDAASAFSHGQVYVALSRCRSLEGIELSSQIPASAIKTDQQVTRFSQEAKEQAPTQSQLNDAKIKYQQSLLTSCFDFQPLQNALYRLINLISFNQKIVQFKASSDPKAVLNQFNEEILQVGIRFQKQLSNAFSNTEPPEESSYIQNRVIKSYGYFNEKLEQFKQWLTSLHFSSDNKELSKNYMLRATDLEKRFLLKQSAIRACQNGFQTNVFLESVAQAQIEEKKGRDKKTRDQERAASIEDLKLPELFALLSDWRRSQAKAQSVEPYQVLHQRILIQIADSLPTTKSALKKIRGIGPKTLEKYGEAILKIVTDYCREQEIDPALARSNSVKNDSETNSVSDTPAPKLNSNRENTKQISLNMYKQGMSIKEIAAERELVTNTIENHLAHFVERGELTINEFISESQLTNIEEAIRQFDPSEGLRPVKEILGESASYGEIKMVKAHQAWQADRVEEQSDN